MKIICSKHQRDYYDYLVSYYGYDDHIVYDRRCNSLNKNLDFHTEFLFSICGEYVPMIKNGGEFVFDPSGRKLDWHDVTFFSKYLGENSKLNTEHRQPVLLINRYTGKVSVPILKEFGFPAHIDAHEMYQKVYAFLSWLKDNPAPPDNQTDVDKTVAHGFDLKTSFRPKMKI